MTESEAERVEPAPGTDYSESGVDLTLIRWTLSMTPEERLDFLDGQISDILALRALNGRV